MIKMKKWSVLVCVLLLGSTSAWTEDKTHDLSGISIIGNKELPKSLVIVPWKSPKPSDTEFSLQRHLDEYLRPVDREVFARKVSFYLQHREAP